MIGRWYICGAILSLFGAIFLGIIGAIIYLQSDYIHGLKLSVSRENTAQNCWFGAIMYAVTFLFCILMACYRRHQEIKEMLAKAHPYELKELKRSLESWENLGSPARLEDHQVIQ
ncbi:hypothetical protein THRCLA_22549 [Thraustotheca clavata]|uniref:Transmembrane protein n=1 Tax=Thraustotheca clavata TaxID=74557 RepID=A0A1V9YXQ0_9STRA|nr:hypothetical protein THRCLA_22549 [Thraustotheca clavata]